MDWFRCFGRKVESLIVTNSSDLATVSQVMDGPCFNFEFDKSTGQLELVKTPSGMHFFMSINASSRHCMQSVSI